MTTISSKHQEIAAELACAYQGRMFRWERGFTNESRTHDIGSMGWPWNFRHDWRVRMHHKTRDALLRHGIIEKVPREFASFCSSSYRVTVKVLGTFDQLPTEADRKAHPGTRRVF